MAELEIERDDRFVANERRTHRVAVAVMALVVLGGALGVFGFGPLASTTRRGAGVTVTYDRFGRNGAPLRLTVDQTRPGPLRVWLSDALLEGTRLDGVVPAPASEQRTAAGATFSFEGSDTAAFEFTGNEVGLVRGRVGRSPTDTMPVTIVLYP